MARGLKKTSEGLRKSVQASVGAGAKAVKDEGRREAEAAKTAREKTLAANKAADEGTLLRRAAKLTREIRRLPRRMRKRERLRSKRLCAIAAR